MISKGFIRAHVCLTATTTALFAGSACGQASASHTHHIKHGQSLEYLAHHYHVSVHDILAANHLDEGDELRSGRKIYIPDAPRALNVPATMRKHARLTGDRVSLRSGPASTRHRIRLCDEATKVVVTAQRHGWYQVRLADGKTGWVRSDFVKMSSHGHSSELAHASHASARRLAQRRERAHAEKLAQRRHEERLAHRDAVARSRSHSGESASARRHRREQIAARGRHERHLEAAAAAKHRSHLANARHHHDQELAAERSHHKHLAALAALRHHKHLAASLEASHKNHLHAIARALHEKHVHAIAEARHRNHLKEAALAHHHGSSHAALHAKHLAEIAAAHHNNRLHAIAEAKRRRQYEESAHERRARHNEQIAAARHQHHLAALANARQHHIAAIANHEHRAALAALHYHESRSYAHRIRPEAESPSASNDVVRSAFAYRGTPYRWGQSRPGGFDCSGFTKYVYGRKGVALPRTAAEQFHAGRAVGHRNMKPGDLVFFHTTRNGISHVGMYVGNGKFVHSSSKKSGGVRVDNLDTGYYSRAFRGARRVRQETYEPSGE